MEDVRHDMAFLTAIYRITRSRTGNVASKWTIAEMSAKSRIDQGAWATIASGVPIPYDGSWVPCCLQNKNTFDVRREKGALGGIAWIGKRGRYWVRSVRACIISICIIKCRGVSDRSPAGCQLSWLRRFADRHQ